MMINQRNVRAFIGLHLIHLVELAAGWTNGQYNEVASIETAERFLREAPPSAGVLCSASELTEALLNAGPAAVFVRGDFDKEGFRRCLDLAERLDVPLILLKAEISLEKLRDLLRFSIKLNLQFAPGEYESVNFLLAETESGAEHSLCDMLSVYFSAEVVLLDAEFQQIDGCLYEWDLHYKFQAIDCIRSWYHDAPPADERAGEIDGRHVCVLPLTFRKSLLGYLSVLGTLRNFEAVDRQVLRQAGCLGLKNLLFQKEVEDVKSRYKDNFIYDLLYDNFKSGYDLAQVFRRWGMELSQNYQLFVLQPDEAFCHEKERRLLQEIEQSAVCFFEERRYYVISAILHEQAVVIFHCKNHEYRKNPVKELAEALKDFLNGALALPAVSIGIGRFYAGVGGLHKSYEEAKQALILAGFVQGQNKVSHFEDLGIMALLAQLDKEKLMEYNQMIIGRLIRYDRENETNYFRMLQFYFEYNCNLNMTAEALFMHANTVRNHLKKIEEILGADLQDFNDCLQIYLACKTYWIVNLK